MLCLGKFASLGLTRSTCFAHGCGLSVRQQAFLRAALRRAASWSLLCSNQVTQSVSFLPCQVNHSPNNKGKSLLCLQSVSLILRIFMGSLSSLEKSAVFLCTICKLGPYTNIVMHFSVLCFPVIYIQQNALVLLSSESFGKCIQWCTNSTITLPLP